MKKNFSRLLTALVVIIFTSCSPDEVQKEPGIPAPAEAVDTYNYVVLRNDGQLFEIGNRSGRVTAGSTIPGLEFNALFNGIASSATKIYIYEHEFDPFRGYIHVYDRMTKKTEVKALELSEEIFGEAPALISLEWNEADQSLIAIVKEDLENNNNLTGKVARIDPVSFEVNFIDVEFEKGYIKSAVYSDGKIYASALSSSTGRTADDFFAIDVKDKTVAALDFADMDLPPLRLSKSPEGNTLFGFLPVRNSSFASAARPVLLNMNTREITPLLPEEVIGLQNDNGKSFYNSETKEHVEIITSETYMGLFQYNKDTGEPLITKIEVPNNMSSLIQIIDARKL